MRVIYATIALLAWVACGPAPRGESHDAAVVPPHTDASFITPADAPVDAAPCGQVIATIRDFHSAHPDMQKGVGTDLGLVRTDLGADNKPAYAPLGATATVSGQASFDQWYRDMTNVNVSFQRALPLVEAPAGTFTYDNQQFFPIDGLGFGDEGNPHNYHFTSEIHTTFTYHGGETFQFSGDDDVFVFVNKKLAIDLGGVHDPLTGAIDFDARTAELGIAAGNTYQLDVFQAERHTVGSTFKMVTTIDCLVIF